MPSKRVKASKMVSVQQMQLDKGAAGLNSLAEEAEEEVVEKK